LTVLALAHTVPSGLLPQLVENRSGGGMKFSNGG